MAITSYCKKCAQDVAVGEVCPLCGGKLPKNAARVVWCLEHTPVKDWMCWNAALRIMAPAALAVLMMIVLLEGLAGGLGAVELLLRQGLLGIWGILCLVALGCLYLALALQGEDWTDCVVDSKGVHIAVYVVNPTPLKLLARLRAPSLIQQAVPSPQGSLLLVQQREATWKEISRVQLWPEKAMVLFYAPAWWMCLALPCSAFQYAAVLDFMRDKVGRRKDLLLPEDIKAAPKPRKSRKAATTPPVQEVEEPALPPEDTQAMAGLLEEMRQYSTTNALEDEKTSTNVTEM